MGESLVNSPPAASAASHPPPSMVAAVEIPAAQRMKYRFLGDTGLLVSALAWGNWTSFSDKFDEEDAYNIMKCAVEHGVNFFDNAESYSLGKSETEAGKAIARGIREGLWDRSDLVLTTKVYLGSKSGPNAQGLSRKHVIEGVKASLQRMQLDYVDVLYCHRPDKYTPIEETVRAMNFVINQGWAFYWGTSEWTSLQITEACDIADRLGLIRPVVEQPQYNIFERTKVEYDYLNLYAKYKLGVTCWSPLSFGLLTGKYSSGITEGSRLAQPLFSAYAPDLQDRVTKAKELAPVAAKMGCSMAQLALAWCMANKNVSSVIMGASSVKQMQENLQALQFVDQITDEVKAEIDAIVQFTPCLPPKPDLFTTARDKWVTQ